MILLTVVFPVLNEKLRDCWESPVAKKRNVTANLASAVITFRIFVSFLWSVVLQVQVDAESR